MYSGCRGFAITLCTLTARSSTFAIRQRVPTESRGNKRETFIHVPYSSEENRVCVFFPGRVAPLRSCVTSKRTRNRRESTSCMIKSDFSHEGARLRPLTRHFSHPDLKTLHRAAGSTCGTAKKKNKIMKNNCVLTITARINARRHLFRDTRRETFPLCNDRVLIDREQLADC